MSQGLYGVMGQILHQLLTSPSSAVAKKIKTLGLGIMMHYFSRFQQAKSWLEMEAMPEKLPRFYYNLCHTQPR